MELYSFTIASSQTWCWAASLKLAGSPSWATNAWYLSGYFRSLLLFLGAPMNSFAFHRIWRSSLLVLPLPTGASVRSSSSCWESSCLEGRILYFCWLKRLNQWLLFQLLLGRHLARSSESPILHELYISSYYYLPAPLKIDSVCLSVLSISYQISIFRSLIQLLPIFFRYVTIC